MTVREQLEKKYGKTASRPIQPAKSTLSKIADTVSKPFEWTAKNMLAPTIKAIETGMAQPIREMQRIIPGGKTGEEEYQDIFGNTLKDVKQQTTGENLSQAFDVASFVLPVEKLITEPLKYVGKTGKAVLKGAGEILTGVDKSAIGKWYDLAKTNPRKIESLKELVKNHPEEPNLGLVNKIADRFTQMKQTAQESWIAAKNQFNHKFPYATFDLSYKVPELKAPLEEFGLTLTQVRNKAGKFIDDFVTTAKGKLSPFTSQETKHIQDLVNILRNAKEYSVDDIITIRDKFDEAYDAVKYGVDGKPKKYHALIMSLKEEADKFIDGVLPRDLKEANKMYKDYHDAFNKIGNKIMDSTGSVKQGAETFISNIMNLNKGVDRNKVIEASNKLGINILDEAKNIKTAKELTQLVPQTTKNRTMDIVRALATRGLGTAISGGGVATGNFPLAVTGVLLNIITSPTAYRGLLEAIAGTTRNIPVTRIIETLSPTELQLLRSLLVKPVSVPLQNANNPENNQ